MTDTGAGARAGDQAGGGGSGGTPPGPRLPLPGPFVLLSLGLLAVGLSFWRPVPVGVWHDDGVYMLIGKALAQGEGLRYAGVPGSPPAVKFPPLYPGLLAVLWTFLGSVGPVTLAAEILNLLFVATAGGVLGWALHRGAGVEKGAAAGVAALAFLSAEVWRPALVPLSEALFVVLAAAAMATWTAASRRGDRRGVALLAGALTLAVLARSAGVALVLGFGLALALRRGIRAALAATLPPLGAAVAWGWWASAHARQVPEGMRDVLGPYGGWLIGQVFGTPLAFLRALPVHVWIVGDRMAAMLIPGLQGWVLWVCALPLLVLAVAGGAQLWRRFPPLVLVPLAYLAMVLVWPFVDRRLLSPMHPWVVILVGVGVLSCAARWTTGARRAALLAVTFVWVMGYASVNASRVGREWAVAGYQLRAGRMAAAVEALKRTAPSGAVVGAPEFWAALHLHGGWPSIPSARFTPRTEDAEVPLWGTPQEQLSLWWEAGVDMVLLEQGGQVHGAALDLLHDRCPGAVSRVAEMPPQILVRITWNAACAAELGLESS